jgi:small GTP-binding protein
MKKFKVILLGDGGSGKSSVRKRFEGKEGEGKEGGQKKTVRGMKKAMTRKVVKLESGENVVLEVHDTGGMERYATIPRNYYVAVHGAMIVYDMTEKDTLENAPWWHREGERNGTDSAVYMLVGNKVDAIKGGDVKVKAEKNKGREAADGFDAMYNAVSAKTGENINEAFLELAQAMVDNGLGSTEGDGKRSSVPKITTKKTKKGGFCVLL